MKIQATNQEKIFANDISDKNIVSKICFLKTSHKSTIIE